MTDPENTAPEKAPENRDPRAKRALRIRTVKFVVVFIVSVLTLLTSYSLAKRTRANDWYLFQVARSTSLLLRGVAYSCELGTAHRHKGNEARCRTELEAWERGEQPPAAPPPGTDASPLTPAESWRYEAALRRNRIRDAAEKVARLEKDVSLPEAERAKQLAEAKKQYEGLVYREMGPLVSLIFKASPVRKLGDARARLTDLRRDTGLDEATRTQRIADAEQDVARLKEDVAAAKNAGGNAAANRDVSFSFIVIPDCGAIPSMAIFFSAVLAFPAPLWRRLAGILAGLPILYCINAFRLAFLGAIGALDRGGKWFHFAHEYVWQGIYIVFVVAVWLAWVELLVKTGAPKTEGRQGRGIAAFFLKFAVLAPVCLVVWLYIIPTYTWALGHISGAFLKYVLRYPVTELKVEAGGFLNTGTQLSFAVGGRWLTMPDIGHLVTNVAPFVALVLATSGLSVFRRLRILGIGIGIIVVAHAATIVLRLSAGRTVLPTAVGFVAITLTFILWIVLAYWDKLLAYFEVRGAGAGKDAGAPSQ